MILGDYAVDEFYEALKDAAFEVLQEELGLDEASWADILVECHGETVTDALGDNPYEVFSALADLWESPYLDPNTDIEKDFSEWAEVFSNETTADIYYTLVAVIEAKEKQKKMIDALQARLEDTREAFRLMFRANDEEAPESQKPK